jgi:cyclase
LLKAVSAAVSVPVVASGGANTPEDFVSAVNAGASAVLAASIFHFGDVTGREQKEKQFFALSG